MRATLLLLVAGCFSPSPPAGAPCPDGVCPRGLVCSPATLTCEKTAVVADEDAGLDGARDAPAGCFGVFATVCPDGGLGPALVQTTPTTLDTSSSPLCVPYHLPSGAADTAYCVIAASTITLSPTGRATITGARPLVIVGNQVQLDGVIDAASHRGGTTGPNANPGACVAGAAPGTDAGGPGGSFGGAGGNGGASGSAPPALASVATPKPTQLRGGCAGRAGESPNTGGAAGAGGGAVYVIAQQLVIGGTINVSGASGRGGGLSAGGGGGGSGGMIVLEAPTIVTSMAARIFANGGGGGEGGGLDNGGDNGIDSTAPTQAGFGGAGGVGGGGDGGDGSAGTTPAAPGQAGTVAGGGGGGGAGAIRVIPPQMLAGAIAPPPS